MATRATADLAAAIELAASPLRRPRMPPVDLRTRLKTTPALRRALPRRVVLARAAAKGTRLWEEESERERALAAMSAILAGTPRAGEIDELARAHLIEDEANKALFWAPWRTSAMDERSTEEVRRAFSSGRRVLVSACHLGPFFLQISPIIATGVSTIAVSAPWFFARPTPDYWGRRVTRWWRGCAGRGERLAYSVHSFEVIRTLIERGEVVLIYFDLPGSVRTDFLGKPVMLASGTARLAHQTDALVLPLRARRDGARVWTDVWAALDTRSFAGPDELHRALAAVHERSILEMPEAFEDPGRAGAWESGARPDQWARPPAR